MLPDKQLPQSPMQSKKETENQESSVQLRVDNCDHDERRGRRKGRKGNNKTARERMSAGMDADG